MNTTRALIVFACLATLASAAIATEPEWVLVWSDEFDGPQLDSRRWRIEDASLDKNNELQNYAPDEAYVEDGCLVLRSRRRARGGRQYTSGAVDTRGRFAQAFGRFEIRAKLPPGIGLWPAIWMLPADGTWPPEIDIMELIGDDPRTVHMTHHAGEYPDLISDGGEFTGPDFTQDFHTFAVEWTPDRLDWYVDGVKQATSESEIPQHPFYIILNTAVGGNWPGDPDATTPFPAYHRIDYVRVYTRKEPGRAYLHVSGRNGTVLPNPERYAFTPGAEVTLRATPDIGYRFARWAGDVSDRRNPARVKMESNMRIAALFEPDPNTAPLVSAGKPVRASSIEEGKYAAARAVDGDEKTRWSSNFADPQWIEVDLGAVHRIEGVRLNWERAAASSYDIQVSADRTSWQTVHSRKGGRGGVETFTGLKAPGRYVRMLGHARKTEYGYSLWEFEVYGRIPLAEAQ